jgi:CcmD family protein
MDNLGYLFAAYSLIFLLIGLYVLFVGQRQKRLESLLAELEASVQDVEKRVALEAAAKSDNLAAPRQS